MDLNTVTGYRFARTRADLALAPGERYVAGGTWMFSEPQVDTTGLVDLTGMDWPALERLPDGGLRIAATCPIVEITRLPAHPAWRARPLFTHCANALLASFKIWQVATVGGNICRSFAAASMVSLTAGLDGIAVLWRPNGGERRIPVAQLITGNGTNIMAPDDVLRCIEIPGRAMGARTAFRKIALAELGRSGAVVTGRLDDDGTTVIGITAATDRPNILRYHAFPEPDIVRADVLATNGYYTDPLGAADWRRGVSAVLAGQVLAELADGPVS